MRFQDLSPADQKLLNTDMGDFEKEAAAELALADEMYTVGFEKLAAETADYLEEIYAAEKTASEDNEGMDDESEKRAHDLAAFIERGYFDGLRKLGSERYNDEMVYLYPFIEEKIASEGAKAALGKAFQAVRRGAQAAGRGAKSFSPAQAMRDIKGGKNTMKTYQAAKAGKDPIFGKGGFGAAHAEGLKTEAGKSIAKGVGKLGLYGAGGALAAGGAYKGLKGKKED